MIVLLLSLYFGNQKIERNVSRGSLTLDVLFYLGWVLLSFLLNFIFSMDSAELQGRRIISLGMAFLLISGFFIGRSFYANNSNTKTLINGILFTYLLVMLYISFIFLSQPSLDLYVVRRIIGQRLPFVIAFVSTLAAVYFFFDKPKKFYKLYYFSIMILGVLGVVFSLTRAAYIQLFISFIILFMNEIRKYFFRGVFIFALILSTSFVFLKLFSEYSSVKQITSRVELLFDIKAQSQEDESGSFRIEMWKFLIGKLFDDPVRLLIGYGQLGPTHVARDFVSSDGISGNNAHNQYLDIVVREGLVGLFFFLWLCYKSLAMGFSVKGVPDDVKLFILANSIGLTGVMFYGFFHETVRYPLFGFYFWLYLGILSKLIESK